MNHLTVLLGAGSTLDLGLPKSEGLYSTKELTDRLIRENYPLISDLGTPYFPKPDPRYNSNIYKNPTQHNYQIPIISLIYHSLKSHYDVVDFELLLHSIEQLTSFADSTRYVKPSDPFRFALASFTEIQERHKLINDPLLLHETRRHFVKSLFSMMVDKILTLGGSQKASIKLKELFDSLKQTFFLKTFSLNYDDLIDEALPEGYDGFDNKFPDFAQQETQSFNPKGFLEAILDDNHLLVHLHGSVRFGDSKNFDKLVKFKDSTQANKSLQNIIKGSNSTNGQHLELDPIISGLNKAAKLIHNPKPYGYYYRAFMDNLLNSHRLLVIGYGGRDEHLNTWMREFIEFHGEKRRVVWISKIDDIRVPGIREPGMREGIRPEGDPEINLLVKLSNKFNEINARYDPNEPDHFQDHGPNLRLIPSGFPLKDPEILGQIIEYLNSK